MPRYRPRPTLGEVADIIRRHGALLADHFGEDKGMRDIRKHIAWYLHGLPGRLRSAAGIGTGQEPERTRSPARWAGPGRAVSGHCRRPPGTAGVSGFGDPARGVARRPRRLHGARRCRRHELGRLNPAGIDIGDDLEFSQVRSVAWASCCGPTVPTRVPGRPAPRLCRRTGALATLHLSRRLPGT